MSVLPRARAWTLTCSPSPPLGLTYSAIHLIGHYLSDPAADSADGPLDGPDSDASSTSDWDLEEEMGGPELELPPSLQAIKAHNDAFE